MPVSVSAEEVPESKPGGGEASPWASESDSLWISRSVVTILVFVMVTRSFRLMMVESFEIFIEFEPHLVYTQSKIPEIVSVVTKERRYFSEVSVPSEMQ